jgi:16S rRNA (uracil1498-N3)-methyltransferase
MNLFYIPHIEGEIFELDEMESKHAVRVLRLGAGDPIVLVDGMGGWFEATIEDDHPKKCKCRIHSRMENFQPLSYGLHLAVSPTKNVDRFEWFLEKSTEIGITEITPLICRRSERKQIKMERLEKILISAMKQSLKAYKPTLHPALYLEDFLKLKTDGVKGIAHCYPTERSGVTEFGLSEHYTMLVGPEGDFTEEEVRLALKAGYTPFHLGQSRLRTETAAVYICTAVQLLQFF